LILSPLVRRPRPRMLSKPHQRRAREYDDLLKLILANGQNGYD
jgi:hypothetical protein